MPVGVLVDLRKCMGCRGCQVACKRWNDLPAEKTTLSPEWTNPPDFGPNTWTFVKFKFISGGNGGTGLWRFAKRQCMHCVDPSCVAVCPTKALYKTPEGPVLYDEEKCIGCRYCVNACPFHVPRFDWGKGRIIRKCTLCADRLAEGLKPACVATCPPGALRFFAERSEAIEEADKAAAAGAYVYGKEEAGGTTFIYVSDVPFKELEFPVVGPEAPPVFSLSLLAQFVGVGIIGGAILYGLKRYSERRAELEGG